MEILASTDHSRNYWYDNGQKNILILDIDWGWTWTEAHAAINMNNQILAEQAKKHPVYCVFNFTSVSLMPKGTGTIANMRKLLETDPSVEELQIFVIKFNLLRVLISSVTKAYGLVKLDQKYRYVHSLEEAIHVIEHHQKTVQNPIPKD